MKTLGARSILVLSLKWGQKWFFLPFCKFPGIDIDHHFDVLSGSGDPEGMFYPLTTTGAFCQDQVPS